MPPLVFVDEPADDQQLDEINFAWACLGVRAEGGNGDLACRSTRGPVGRCRGRGLHSTLGLEDLINATLREAVKVAPNIGR
ncbi:hypothetical protein [Mycobacterium sp.]|uniref:hypothetical protein n=1 Tax=Mycobacterium sp. TaxID=1785 RepID=UPI002CB854E3|nr:hypothetical protein [Mycobacterium sp.]HME49292.1 hypothetical protein [Mycobacterium sp.]